MKALLLHPEHDFDARRGLPVQAANVRPDLALDTVVAAMADGDAFVAQVVSNALLNGTGNDMATLRYRQAVVRDAIAHPGPVREMYAVVVGAFEEKRKSYWGFSSNHPSSILYSARQVLHLFMQRLRMLREIAETNAGKFESAGFRNLFAMLQRELDDAYLARVDAHLTELKFGDGTLVSAKLGNDCASDDYILRRPRVPHPNWLQRLLEHAPSAWTVHVAPRDMVGARTLGEMRDRGINQVANVLAQSVDHIQDFFEMLRAELAFHIGCANLHQRLTATGVPICFPDPLSADEAPGFRARALRDTGLVLAMQGNVVANDVDATGKRLVVITGANQGGKSTFLRALGLAQLMLQAGMFVSAEAFASTPCTGLFTHCKREEDTTMQQGKLDEELIRIGEIADAIRPGGLLLCNESFASTNEREGSELAHQMVDAMLACGIRVVFVTHLYAFADGMHAQHRDDTLFLRAERLADGTRSFRLVEAAPRETSHGADLYRDIFGDDDSVSAVRTAAAPAAATESGEAISRTIP
jgi:MutS domain V